MIGKLRARQTTRCKSAHLRSDVGRDGRAVFRPSSEHLQRCIQTFLVIGAAHHADDVRPQIDPRRVIRSARLGFEPEILESRRCDTFDVREVKTVGGSQGQHRVNVPERKGRVREYKTVYLHNHF